MRLLVDIGRTDGVDVRKMGSITPNTDCYHHHHHHHHYHCQQGQKNYNDDHHHDRCGDCCCFVVGSCSSSSSSDSSRGAVSVSIMTCPLRRRITNYNNDVGLDGEEDDVNSYCVCDTNCPSICYNNPPSSNNHGPCLISRGTSSSLPAFTYPASTMTNNSPAIINDISRCISRSISLETSFNDNNINSSKNNSNNDNCSRLRRDSSRCTSSTINEEDSKNSFNCANGSSDTHKRRISSSRSLLTRPCALYLFTVLVILDLSDFSSILITSSCGRTASDSSSDVLNHVISSTMKRYNGFLVNGASNNGNGYHHGAGKLTVSPELPILTMDSVFFKDSIGNQLTGSSESAEEEGENFSSKEDYNTNDDEEEEAEDSIEISRTVEPQMLKRLESQFLKLFGMTKRPQKAAQLKKQIKIPKYLLDLYQKQTGTELPTSNLNLPGRHTRTANTVRTFYHHPGNPKEPSYPWKGRENLIKFNLDSIPSMEKVTGAELRIPFVITVSSDDSETVNSALFRESGNEGVDDGQVQASKDNGLHHHHHHNQPDQLKAVRILLHDITKPATSPSSKRPKESHLLEPITYPIDSKTVVLSKRRNGTSTFWLTFDVFPAVARWMSNPRKNHGLVLEMFGVTNEGHTVAQETVVQRHNLRVKRDVADYENSLDSNEGSSGSSSSSTVSDSTSDASSGNGKGRNSITTESSSSSSSSSSSTSSAAKSSSKSTQNSGESLSLPVAQTPASSSVVSTWSSPTEVGVATDDGPISSNAGKKKQKASSSGDTSSSIVLFTYSDDGHNPVKTRDAKTLSRHYRSAQVQKRRKNHRNKNRKRNLCQRHAMFVDFQDVGWNDWIVAPPGYAAYYCSGECPFPMAEHLNATNHAVIQALVHSMNPALVPPPCCVPTKYSSLSLLYTDSSDKIVLKNYNEMVVDSCGCS